MLFDTMAFEKNFYVSLRQFLLIALLILIIHALSSDYGVNGEDELRVNDGRANGVKEAGKGVLGATGSDSVPGVKRSTVRGHRRRSTGVTIPSSSPLGSTAVKVDDSKSASKQEQEKSKEGVGMLKGPTGKTSARKDMTNSATETDDETEDNTLNEGKDTMREKPSKTGGGSEGAYQEEEDDNDEAVIQLNPSENIFAESEKNQVRPKPPIEDVSSASSFMTYFVVIAILVIIAYLIFHNKKKLMAYIVEGRNTSRGRRQRPASGAEYKVLKDTEEASGSRPEDA